jgi:MFS family permease
MFDNLGQVWTFLIPGILTFFAASISFIVLSRSTSNNRRLDSIASESRIEAIKSHDIFPCIRSIFSNPISYIAVMGIFADGISFGTCESTLPALLFEWNNGQLDVIIASLIYSVGPLTFTIFAPIAGFCVDKLGHCIVMLTGLCLMIIFYPIFQIFSYTLPGLGACIGLAYGIASIAEVSVYPFVAHIVEETGIANADVIGYALADTFIQAGYAIGNIVGRRLFDWNGLLAMGIFDASICASAVLISLTILAVTKGGVGEGRWFARTPVEMSTKFEEDLVVEPAPASSGQIRVVGSDPTRIR